MKSGKCDRVLRHEAKDADDFLNIVENVKQFIEKKRYELRIIGSTANQNYVYRGHADAKWSLQPSAFRSKNATLINYLIAYAVGDDPVPDMFSVCDFINQFTLLANKRGLEIPGLTNEELHYIKDHDEKSQEIELGTPFSHRIALAQHYGLHTPFLDWTERPLTACYFAASDAMNMWVNGDPKKPEKIAVWALNVNEHNYLNKKDNLPPVMPFQIHEVPKYGNKNLVAQQGVFSYIKEKSDGSLMTEPMESEVLDNYSVWHLPMLIKIELDICHVAPLIYKLFEREVDASTLFPGYSGVAKAVVESAMLEQFCRMPEIEKRCQEFEEQKDKTE